MTKEGLVEFSRKVLKDYLELPGSILYSSGETLRQGNVYLLGFNPGGEGGDALSKNMDTMLSSTTNAYTDEEWSNDNGAWKAGQAPLQKRVIWLLESLGLKPKEVCASNLIFIRSKKATDVSYSVADICWPVHEKIISIVQPELIIAIGNSSISPYGYLLNRFSGDQVISPSGHGNWNIKGFKTHILGRRVFILGLPHLSRYSPIGKKEVLDWIKSHTFV